LGRIAVEPLIEALGKDDTRQLAIKVLTEIGDERAKEPLIKALLDDYDWGVRWDAIRALGGRAVEPLIEMLGADKESVRWDAVRALGEIGDARAVKPLIETLRDEDSNVRWYATETLGKIGDERAIEPLIKALGDDNVYVRDAAKTALAKLGHEAK
jgi:HEAT repeat protein